MNEFATGPTPEAGAEEDAEAEAAPSPEQFEDLAAVEDVRDGDLLGVRKANGEEVCIFNYRGSIGAVYDVCTHAEFSMSDGILHPDGTIECAWHGARFQACDGCVCRGPATDALPTYHVRVANGRILVGPRKPQECP